ncbi:MFS transporter [uncultured Eubacterium sp.]|uniref:MFS transporter n=1 Tax=uncultured Eubacterium sp. TaxID=165185 RepID=UPI0015BD8077|nr:MFS transporter [uncultured Eubacterium sp.]
MTKYTLEDIKKSRLIVIALWLIYASAYFGRTCYSAAIASIVSNGVYTKSEIGLVGTAFFICYGAGQIISGFAGDRVNPFAMILFGILGSSACCFSMAFTKSLSLMAVIWGINGIFQSMLWAPLLRVFSQTINSKLREKAVLNIALSLPVGTVCAYLCSTLIIKYSSWKNIFICGGSVVLTAFLFGLLSVICSEKSMTRVSVKTEKSDKNARSEFLPVIISSGLLIIIMPSFLHGMMRDGITNWVPTMITEEYGVLPSFSVFLTIVLPIFNAFGAYIITPLYKRLGCNETKTAGICAIFAIIPMTLLLFIGKIPVIVSIILLALTTMSMYSLNYIIISRVPVRFAESGHTSSVTGILNSFAYIGCAVSSYGFGAISQKAGWNSVIVIWIISALLTSLFAFSANGKWKKFIMSR